MNLEAGYKFGIFGHEDEKKKKMEERERDGISNDNDGDCWRFLVRGGNSCQTRGTMVKRELFVCVRIPYKHPASSTPRGLALTVSLIKLMK
jgi:hypothetical protein